MGIALSYVFTLASYAAILLLGQGLIYVLSFGKHEANAVYRLMRLLTSPVVKPTRWITPKQVTDRHVPLVAFLLLFWVCIGLSVYLPTIMQR